MGVSFLLTVVGRELQRREVNYCKPTCPHTPHIILYQDLAIFHAHIGSLVSPTDTLEAEEGPPLRFHVPNGQEVNEFFQRWPGANAKVAQQSLAMVWCEIM